MFHVEQNNARFRSSKPVKFGMRQLQICIAMIVLGICLRVTGVAYNGMPNFQLLPLFLLLSAWTMKLGWKKSMLMTMSIWVFTDLVIAMYSDSAVISWDLVGIIIFYGISYALINYCNDLKLNARTAMLASVVAAFLFYFTTNTVSFLTMPELYSKTLVGFWQAQWVGPDGYGPTWCFLKTGLLGNLLASVVFLLAQHRFCIYHMSAKEQTFVRL